MKKYRQLAQLYSDALLLPQQIPKNNFKNISNELIKFSIKKLSKISYEMTKEMARNKSFARKRAFYSMQFVNAEMALEYLGSGINYELVKDQKFKSSFENVIRHTGLDFDQIIHFAWICAIRALPFLFQSIDYCSVAGHQTTIYSLLNILDCVAVRGYLTMFDIANSDKAATAYPSDSVFTHAAHAVMHVARAYSRNDDDAVVHTAAAAVSAIKAATGATHTLAGEDRKIKMEQILHEDIVLIKNGFLDRLNPQKNHYGRHIWGNFRESLYRLKCEYWFNFYNKMFSSSFMFSEKEVKYRLNTPSSIKEEGAAAVAMYMTDNYTE